jgi:hypothetical protein
MNKQNRMSVVVVGVLASVFLPIALAEPARPIGEASDSSYPAIPFPAALDAADVARQALVLGNGDLNGLLYAQGTELRMRITKNDVWDARVDTSRDPPMAVFDVKRHSWKGGVSDPASWGNPYPQPRVCANLILADSGPVSQSWQKIRSAARDSWSNRDGLAVMGIEGTAEASNGYGVEVPPLSSDRYPTVKLRLAGSDNAQYYVDLVAPDGSYPLSSGWQQAPHEEVEKTLKIPASKTIIRLMLYAKTRNGKAAEVRYRRIAFEGTAQQYVVDLANVVNRRDMKARLDLRRAMAEVGLPNNASTVVRVRALAQKNTLLIEGDRMARLTPQPASFLPAAEVGETETVTWVRQRMPADQDYPGMEVVTAVGRKGRQTAVAVVTSWEANNPLQAAVKLVRNTLAADAAVLTREHEQVWNRFWAASGVKLGDRDFQDWWYRMVYYMRCFSKPEVVPVGLFAGMATDETPWHSSYKINYNIWQTFWAPFAVNHGECADPWVRYMKQSLPRAQWFAKASYGCQGACYHSDLYPFEPDAAKCTSKNRRQCAYVPWGYTLGMSGMAAQVLWQSYLYRPDRTYLDQWIYPPLREVALFYLSFMEKCQRDAHGKVRLGPSFSPEHGPFGTDNNPYDLAYVRYTFTAAIEAARILDRDRDLMARITRMQKLLPSYPTAPDPTGRLMVVDWTGCKFGEVGEHNITVPAVPVFPGDQVTWFSSGEEKELFKRTIVTIRHNHNNANVMLNVARARLSMPDAISDTRQWFKGKAQPNGMFAWLGHGYYLSESTAVASLISEFLLQSAGGIIRVFPCWPKDLSAEFTDLAAQGGFLVSARHSDGSISGLRIRSTVGGTLRLASPWKRLTVRRDDKIAETVQPDGRGIVTQETWAGERMEFSLVPDASNVEK